MSRISVEAVEADGLHVSADQGPQQVGSDQGFSILCFQDQPLVSVLVSVSSRDSVETSMP
jgi:hypothetical protein